MSRGGRSAQRWGCLTSIVTLHAQTLFYVDSLTFPHAFSFSDNHEIASAAKIVKGTDAIMNVISGLQFAVILTRRNG